jgi:hypothetical protein
VVVVVVKISVVVVVVVTVVVVVLVVSVVVVAIVVAVVDVDVVNSVDVVATASVVVATVVEVVLSLVKFHLRFYSPVFPCTGKSPFYPSKYQSKVHDTQRTPGILSSTSSSIIFEIS